MSHVFGNGETYVKRYDILRQKCKQNFYDIVLIRQLLQGAVQDILEQDHHCLDINVLGVGSGDGNPDIEIARIIKEELLQSELYRQTKISSISIEPNEYFLSHFQILLKNLPSSLLDGHANFKFLTQSFEDFIAENTRQPSAKFQIIHFIHSIYHFEIEKILMKCFDDLLTDDGKVFCILNSKNDISYKLCLKQGHLSSTGEPISADQVLEVVKKHGWKYRESTIEFTLDATDVFDEDSVEGNYQLDFMTQTLNFRATADPKRFQETMEIFKELTTIENGRRVGKRIDKLLMIEK